MPTILVRGNEVSTEEPFELQGFTRLPITSVFVEDSIKGTETPVEISLSGGTEPPEPVVSAHILGLPLGNQAQELTTITTLSAELRNDDGTVAELYNPANWNWVVVSGGGSFTGDDLTLPAAPATVMISATHATEELVATVQISVVATVAFTADFFNLSAQLVQGQQTNPLRSRVLDPDGLTVEQIDTNWTYSVLTGPGSISGSAGNQVLVANAGSAPSTITVRATYTGSLNVSPATDDSTTSVIVQPTFPAVLELADMTQVQAINGATLNWGAGWNPSDVWEAAQAGTDTTRIEVVSDPLSKFGGVIEKRGFVGDKGGWLGALNVGNNIANHRELYFRMVFLMSPNWQTHSAGGDKLFYWGRKFGSASPTQFYLQHKPNGRVFFTVQNIFNGDSFGASALFRPDGIPSIPRGQYHTIEIRHRLNTIGNHDGSFRFAQNGVEALTFNDGNVDLSSGIQWIDSEWDPATLSGGEFFLFWGGSGDSKEVNDYWRLSELFIGGGN